jgi:hypothetical protein
MKTRAIRLSVLCSASLNCVFRNVAIDSTAIRWAKRWRKAGGFEAKSSEGQSRSPLKQLEQWLLG